MSNLTTNHDIIADALFRANEPGNNTSDFYNQALSDYNRCHTAICSGGIELDPTIDEVWWWLKKPRPGVLTLQPAFTGSASMTFNGTNVTLTNPPSYSLASWFFYVPGDLGDVYRVVSHTAGAAALTLDSVYTSPSNTVASVKIIQLEYDLASDVRAVIGSMATGQNDDFKINGCELEELLDHYPTAQIHARVPRLFAMVGEQRVRFNSYPGDSSDKLIRVEYEYLITPTDLADDTGQPLVPRNYRRVLSDYLCMWILNSKNDPRASNMGVSAASGLKAMAAENRRRLLRMGEAFGRLIPRHDQLTAYRTPRSTSGYIFPG